MKWIGGHTCFPFWNLGDLLVQWTQRQDGAPTKFFAYWTPKPFFWPSTPSNELQKISCDITDQSASKSREVICEEWSSVPIHSPLKGEPAFISSNFLPLVSGNSLCNPIHVVLFTITSAICILSPENAFNGICNPEIMEEAVGKLMNGLCNGVGGDCGIVGQLKPELWVLIKVWQNERSLFAQWTASFLHKNYLLIKWKKQWTDT